MKNCVLHPPVRVFGNYKGLPAQPALAPRPVFAKQAQQQPKKFYYTLMNVFFYFPGNISVAIRSYDTQKMSTLHGLPSSNPANFAPDKRGKVSYHIISYWPPSVGGGAPPVRGPPLPLVGAPLP